MDMNRRNLVLTEPNRTFIQKTLTVSSTTERFATKMKFFVIFEIEVSATENPLDYLLLSIDNRTENVSSYTTSTKIEHI